MPKVLLDLVLPSHAPTCAIFAFDPRLRLRPSFSNSDLKTPVRRDLRLPPALAVLCFACFLLCLLSALLCVVEGLCKSYALLLLIALLRRTCCSTSCANAARSPISARERALPSVDLQRCGALALNCSVPLSFA